MTLSSPINSRGVSYSGGKMVGILALATFRLEHGDDYEYEF